MTGPKFTILLPTHNRPDVLALAVQSVLQQTQTDWELLVVGDGCTDDTATVVAGFGDARIRWFDLPKGLGFGYANRNLALRQASGALIAFLGHDNLLFPDHLAKLEVPFRNPDVMLAYSRPLYILDDGLIIPYFVNLMLEKPRVAFMSRENPLPATTVVHRRSCFDTVGYWPEDAAEFGDWLLWKSIMNQFPKGLRLVRQPTCLHFRATWRDPATWGPAPMQYLKSINAARRWYPRELHLGLNPQSTPQAQVSAMLARDAEGFVRTTRAAVDHLQDSLAWNACNDPNFQ